MPRPITYLVTTRHARVASNETRKRRLRANDVGSVGSVGSRLGNLVDYEP